jgi:hypothetical protein
MNLLAAANYDPVGGAVTKATTSLIAMTAFDTSNLRLAFTVPSHGMVHVRMSCVHHGATTIAQMFLGCLEGTTLRGRAAPSPMILGTSIAAALVKLEVSFTITGLTPGAVNWDAAYGVETVANAGGIKYGGPNNTSGNDAFGGFNFEVWDPRPIPTATPGAAGGLFIAGTNAATTITTGLTTTFTGNLTGSVGSVTGAVGSLTTNNDKTGYTLSAAGIQAVWDALTSALTTVGSIGKLLVDRIDAAITSRLAPTTAGRTLDVTTTGEAGIDWANIGSPTTAVALSNTTVSNLQNVQGVTNTVVANVSQWNGTNVSTNVAGIPRVDITRIDGLATNGNNATLNLKQLNIANNAGDAILASATGGAGKGLHVESTASAAVWFSSTVDDGIYITASGTGVSVNASNGNGVVISAPGPFTDGIQVSGSDYGIRALGAVAGMSIEGNGNGLQIYGDTGNAIEAQTTSGVSINAPQDIQVSDGELTLAAIATATWAAGTRTLTSFGTLVADIWALAIETGYTAKQSMRLILSSLAGKLSGAATTTVTIRSATDAKDRIVATVDSDGNRTAVTHDTTD